MNQQDTLMPSSQSVPLTANVNAATPKPINLLYQERKTRATAPNQCPSVGWEEFITKFQTPTFLGTDSLERYVVTYDDPLEMEDINECMWRPISTVVADGQHTPQNLTGVFAIVFDVEHNLSAADVKSRLTGIKALVHSTYRHSPDDQRWRVIIPQRYAISYHGWMALQEHFQIVFDGRLGDIYRHSPYHWFQYPACPHDMVDQYTVMVLEGAVFDGLSMAAKAISACEKRGCTRIATFASKPSCESTQNEVGLIPFKIASTDSPQMQEAKAVIAKVMEVGITSKEDVEALTEPTALVVTAETIAVTHDLAVVETVSETDTHPASVTLETLPPALTAQYLLDNFDFPSEDIDDLTVIDNPSLIDELESLVQQVKQPDEYLSIRDRYCHIAKELNLRGLLSPAFRPNLQIPWAKSSRMPAHMLIQCDRVVIDCHWLHSQQSPVRPMEANWRPLFKFSKPFDFDLAAKFANRGMANEYRAEAILGLTPFQQFQLRALRGKAVTAQIKAIDAYRRGSSGRIPSLMETVTLTLNRWCEKDRRVSRERDKYLCHARAKALLSFASPSLKEIAALAGFMRGVAPLGESTVREFMPKLEKKLVN